VRTALFDVDGTLVDTNYLHAVTWWEAFGQAGYDVPMTRIHRAIGMGSDQLLDALLPNDRDNAGDSSIRAAHSALYAAYRGRLRPFSRAAELLRACRRSGLDVVLASSADAPEFALLREALAAEDAISLAVSGADVVASKPAPDLVMAALERSGARPQDAVFVGDTVWDVEACDRAGVPCIGVRGGGITGADLMEAGAVAVFADPADLLASTGGQLGKALP
jgi:HAD superfamily hydrolase (TIGR01509 family)